MRNWRRAAALLLALCMTMLLAACGEDPNDEEKLSVVMTGTVRTMDPAQAVTPAERTVVKHVFENLRFTPWPAATPRRRRWTAR